MDAYSRYNQIPIYEPNKEHTFFITDRGLYCYKAMLFGLKNEGATCQRLVNIMFIDLIGKSMEVYMDDMLVKSKVAGDHPKHPKQMFNILRKYQMTLNPLKCAFRVESGKFLGFMLNQHGIQTNPEKIKVLLEMSSPKKPKEVMSLAGRVATLSQFMLRAIGRCTPFFDVLKGSKRFKWIDKYKQALLALKEHIGRPPLLSKPIEGEKLSLYLIVSEEAVSTSLVREEEKIPWPIYYVTKRLLDAKTRYPKLEKLALTLVVTSNKLRSYFHAHSIEVLTNYPLHQVLQKQEA